MGLNDPIANVKALREQFRQAGAYGAAERAREAALNPPAAEYAGFDARSGEAILKLPNGELVRGQPIFNSLIQPGDRVILDPATGRPFADQVSVSPQPEPVEPEPVAETYKLKILFYTPDGGLWIGGDRAVPKRINTVTIDDEGYPSGNYRIANTGDGQFKWIVTDIKDEFLDGGKRRVTVTWLPSGRTVQIQDNTPIWPDLDGGFDPFIPVLTPYYVGGGMVSIKAHFPIGALITRDEGTTTVYNLVDIALDVSGSNTTIINFDLEAGSSSSSFTGSQSFNSLLLTPTATIPGAGSGRHLQTYEGGRIGDFEGYRSEVYDLDYECTVYVAPGVTKTDRYLQYDSTSYVFEGDLIFVPTRDYVRISEKNRANISARWMGHQSGGYWQEEKSILPRFTSSTGTDIPQAEYSNKYYLNGTEVISANAPQGTWTIANGQIYGAVLAAPNLPPLATIRAGFEGQTFTTPYHPIPTEATIIDWSYHP